jgi:hypothetical membrane protein
MKMRVYAISGISIAFAGLFLAFIGLFPSDTGDAHTWFAIGLFALATLGMLLMTAGDWMHNHVMFGGISVMLIALACILFITKPLEYAECAIAAIVMAWLALSSAKMFFLKEKI